MHHSKTLIVFLAAVLVCSEAFAQRTCEGGGGLKAVFGTTFSGDYPYSADISYTHYNLHSFWSAGVSASNSSIDLGEGNQFDCTPVVGYWDWMWRLCSTRGRSVNLYAGGGAFAGCELHDIFSRIPEFIETSLPDKPSFVYGVALKAEADFFVSEKVAFCMSASVPFTVGSCMPAVSAVCGAGIRVDF